MFAVYLIKLVLSLCTFFSLASTRAETEMESAASRGVTSFPVKEQRWTTPDDDECNAKLKVSKLLVRKFKTLCMDAGKANVQELCAESAAACDLAAETGHISTLNVNDLCVTGTIRTNAIEQCNAYRATVVFGANTPYNLSDLLAFDTVLDDPNNNITVAASGTTYTAPVSGYYVVMLQVDAKLSTLVTPPILGTPVARPTMFVNGIPYRRNYHALLAFHDLQQTTLNALISLQAGDVVTCNYDILSMNDAGFNPLVGTVMALGDGTEAGQSMFKIHYLSSDCSAAPCTPFTVDVECTPCPEVSCCS